MPDPTGNDYSQAKAISDSLFEHGCVLGSYPSAQRNDISANPVFQAARRWSRFYRVMRRQELVSYAVSGGTATLKFRRTAYGVTGADAWAGIAPPSHAIASGELLNGEEYIVRGTTGGVSYASQRFTIGQRFTASGATEYTQDGDAAPWVYDGIRHAALAKGWTNEWVFFLQTHVFQPAFNSIWKPEVYADFFGWGERALFYLPSSTPEFREFANTTAAFSVDPDTGADEFEPETTRATWINPEAPTGYRYSSGSNSTANEAFRKSCQVYEKPFEVQSCTLEFSGPEQIVVLTLTERPRAHENAPATVAEDPNTWSADDLARLDGTHGTYPEDYRTPDNALREYLRWANGDHGKPSLKTGDHGYGSSPSPTPWGNVMPTFHFLKLIPEAREDNDDEMDANDTRMLAETHQQAEWYLRAMCEGYVDGNTTAARTCRNTSDAGLYDYTWENLCFEAHGGRDCGAFPVDVRDDRPAGFGPLPNTLTYAEVHNRLCQVANLLTKLRLDVPLQWSTRTLTYRGETDVGIDEGTFGYCDDTTYETWVDNQKPPPATTLLSDSGWTVEATAPTLQGTQSAGLDCADGGNDWVLSNYRTDTEWKVEIAPGWTDAVPTEIQDLVTLGSVGTLAQRIELLERHDRRDEDPRTACDGVPGSWQWYTDTLVDNEVTCVLLAPGTVSSGVPPAGDFGARKVVGGAICGYGSIHSIIWAMLAFPGAFIEVPLSDLP